MVSIITTISLRPEIYEYAKAEGLRLSEICDERIREIKEARELGEEELTASQYREKMKGMAKQLREYNLRYLEQQDLLLKEKDVQK